MTGKKEEGSGDEVEVCDSETYNMQFNVNCQMIFLEGYLIK